MHMKNQLLSENLSAEKIVNLLDPGIIDINNLTKAAGEEQQLAGVSIDAAFIDNAVSINQYLVQ